MRTLPRVLGVSLPCVVLLGLAPGACRDQSTDYFPIAGAGDTMSLQDEGNPADDPATHDDTTTAPNDTIETGDASVGETGRRDREDLDDPPSGADSDTRSDPRPIHDTHRALDRADEGDTGLCPPDMVPLSDVCIDRYEAPNRAGALPLVMYTFNESVAWCEARGKRLCFDDEWTLACGGEAGWSYPYGEVRVAGQCNDEEVWRVYTQSLLNLWPATASTPEIESLEELLASTRARSADATLAADHIEALYQGEGGGANAGCTNEVGAYDLQGNVEEWTRRRDGGDGALFNGNLKGRYWAEDRTCQSGVTSHADGFRFYEIGFRCCQDSP